MLLEYQGLKVKIPEGVYNPNDDTYLLIENLKVEIDDLVLEIGTGSGFVALIAAQTAKKVIATDISPLAIECIINNIKRNHLTSKIEVRKGFLFDPIRVEEKFDLIIFNPPYLPEDKDSKRNNSDWLEKAWDGGKYGRNLIDPFIKKCKFYLNPTGRVQMVQSSLSNITKSCILFQKQGFHTKISASRTFFFEKIVLLDAWLIKEEK